MKRLIGFFVVFGGLFSNLSAADWPMFRGPNLDGIAPDSSAPTAWSPDKNIRWKMPLPQPGNGSPIVSKGRVFVTSSEDGEGKQRSLYCFDENTGKQLWVKTVDFGKKLPTHKTNPYGGTTPAADGERVVVWHASAGLYCYDFLGQELWKKDLGEFKHMWGYGTSPILNDGKVILHTGPGARAFVAAFDQKTGENIWQTDEPQEGDGEHNNAKKYMGSWSTPVIATVDGEDQIIVPHPTRVVAYNPKDGTIVWFCEGIRHDKGDLAYSSCVLAGDICFVTGGFNGPAMAIRLGGEGDVTATHRLWRTERQPQSIGSGVAVDGKVYRPNAGGPGLQCIDPTNGEILWQDRAGGSQWASIVMAGGLLYATNQSAQTTIFKPNPKAFEEVASNGLKDGCNATPAVANGRLLIRTDGHLWCIENE
jgi:outer membrane protein assembly factor BamB